MTAKLAKPRFNQRFPSFDGSCVSNFDFKCRNYTDFCSIDETGCLKKNHINKTFHHLRYIVVMFGGLAIGFMSLLRLNITVAILNMVNQTEIYIENHEGINDFELERYFGSDYVEVGEFSWNNEIQQTIISYYMIAYTVSSSLRMN